MNIDSGDDNNNNNFTKMTFFYNNLLTLTIHMLKYTANYEVD